MTREARQDFLSSHYCFECNCLACEKNYLTLPELKESPTLPWRCLECHTEFENGFCLDCKTKMDVKAMIGKLDDIKQNIDGIKTRITNSKEKLEEIYIDFCESMAQLTSILGSNCAIVIENELLFRSFLCKLFGNKSDTL